MQIISISAYLDNAVEQTISKALHSRFFIRGAFCKVGVCSKYHVMPRIIILNLYQQMLNFDRGKIVAYQKCGLSLCDIARRTGQNPTIFKIIWNPCDAEGHTERHIESQLLTMANA